MLPLGPAGTAVCEAAAAAGASLVGHPAVGTRSRATSLPLGCRYDGCAQDADRAASVQGRVVCSSLDFAHWILPPDTLPNCTDSEQQDYLNGSFSGLSLLERLLWSMPPLEATSMSVILPAAAGRVDVHGPCCCCGRSAIQAASLKPCGSPMIRVATGCYGQRGFLCSGINDCVDSEPRMRDKEGFCNNLAPDQTTAPSKKETV